MLQCAPWAWWLQHGDFCIIQGNLPSVGLERVRGFFHGHSSAGVPEPSHEGGQAVGWWTTLDNICSSLLGLLEFGGSRQGNMVCGWGMCAVTSRPGRR